MQTFKDKWDTTLCTDRVEAYAEIIIIEPCERRFTMYFSAQEARKIGRALIELANEIEPPVDCGESSFKVLPPAAYPQTP